MSSIAARSQLALRLRFFFGPSGILRCADAMSALGQKRTFGKVRLMSALPPIADIGTQACDVCFVPKADIHSSASTSIRGYEPTGRAHVSGSPDFCRPSRNRSRSAGRAKRPSKALITRVGTRSSLDCARCEPRRHIAAEHVVDRSRWQGVDQAGGH